MTDKQIRVTQEVHTKVARIAKANYRGMIDQVAYWADTTCEHPVQARETVSITVTPLRQSKTLNANRNLTFQGFYCTKCQQYIFTYPANNEVLQDGQATSSDGTTTDNK